MPRTSPSGLLSRGTREFADSPLEGDGFELSVPLAKERRFRPLITRNSLTTTPSAFQIGGIPYAPKESREQQRQRFSPDPSP
jgi:hypothetical protein